MKDINDVFGKNVRFHRLKREISQEKLAELADLHRTYIGAIERKGGEKCFFEKRSKDSFCTGCSCHSII
ncbi:helix-turn-helix transcriptional regulator [Acinetobacter corruptisaponis]|uniref:Helix-turn-helix transcriptional regulator n=1 Tax=Acinetobacter corruptisaponis TaxID=3045147 RepID=A0ABY8S3A9_9GAMM|nr:helix-turn-helix transcriptional regulator [Acinetobacter sp. KCTC 92772]WHP04694.1 helix-turn-helix transcriptional regulator [Acinetobacter sp. KCTC 92772]